MCACLLAACVRRLFNKFRFVVRYFCVLRPNSSCLFLLIVHCLFYMLLHAARQNLFNEQKTKLSAMRYEGIAVMANGDPHLDRRTIKRISYFIFATVFVSFAFSLFLRTNLCLCATQCRRQNVCVPY